MLSTLFNKIGAKSMYVAASVQEAGFAAALHYGQFAMRLVG